MCVCVRACVCVCVCCVCVCVHVNISLCDASELLLWNLSLRVGQLTDNVWYHIVNIISLKKEGGRGERERERECVCVCVCERERERERGGRREDF